MVTNKLKSAIQELEVALTYKDKALAEKFFFSGIAKSFEVCFEYCWKQMKFQANKEGLEVYSPRDAIKSAGRLKIIEDVELWLSFLENRNLAVHDYLGIGESEYIAVIEKFLREVKKLNFI